MQKILIIEDSREIRKMLTELFSLAGFEVTDVGDGKLGLDLATHHRYHAIVCDLKMPEMDGLAFLEALSKHPNLQQGPIMILSNVAYPYANEEAIRRGASAFVSKDEVEPKQILEQVQKLILDHSSTSA